LINQASDQRHLCGEKITGFRKEDVQSRDRGSYYIFQLHAVLTNQN